MDAALHRTQRLIEHSCYLEVFISFKIKHERLFKYYRQIIYCHVNIFNAQICFCTISNNRLLLMQQEFSSRIIQQTELPVTTPVVIDKDITHDSVKPCANVCTGQVFIAVGQRTEK